MQNAESVCRGLQIDCLLPASKVSFTKFGERYCLTQNHFPRGQSFYSNKYDGVCLFPPLSISLDRGKMNLLFNSQGCRGKHGWSFI